ncbi:MAG: SCO family protein [Aquihabitans sp.]
MADPRTPWSRRRFLGSAGTGAAVLVLGACGLNRGASVDRAGQPESGSFGGTEVDPPFDKPDRTFIDHNGQPFNLRADTKDRLAILFFGYTNCPDVCPVYLNQMSSAIKAIGTGPGSRPMVLFVGVDTARDTPEVLKGYLSDFGELFIGLSADDETIAAALDDLTLPQVILREPDENGDYYVDHAAYAVAFSPDNLGHRIYSTGTVRQQDWVEDLPRLDQGKFV